jgi:hypothetical protein
MTTTSIPESWWTRLLTWPMSPNPVLSRCRCGYLPTVRRDHCPCCGRPTDAH